MKRVLNCGKCNDIVGFIEDENVIYLSNNQITWEIFGSFKCPRCSKKALMV
jgi:hypothetical protein